MSRDQSDSGGGWRGAEKMLVLVVVITAVGEQRAHVGPVCLVAGSEVWGWGAA